MNRKSVLHALALVACLTWATVSAQSVSVYMPDVSGNPGSTVTIPVSIYCDMDMTAFLMRFSTDLGVGFTSAELIYRIDPSATTYIVPGGTIMAHNTNGTSLASLEAGDGVVAELYLKIPADAEPGTYTMTLYDMMFQPIGTSGSGSALMPDDVTVTLTVNGTTPQAYACYTPSNTTLTFYYDTQRRNRTGYTYDLNIGSHDPEWYSDEMNWEITRVVFSQSFTDARPTSTYKWFSDMPNLTTIRGMKEYLNTSEVTTMSNMFYNCSSLTSLDVSGFNTAKVTDMSYMFESCSELTTLNLSTFNTAKVSNMREMFRDCSKLVTIYVLSSWTTTAVSSSSQMFKNCTKIKGGKGTAYNANYIDKTYARIDGGTSSPGYLTEKPIEAYACYTPSNTTLTFYYDNNRDSRTGTTYDLNTGNNTPGWYDDDNNERVTKVVFNSSFSGARPTSTCYWFNDMGGLTTITGMKEYLNTSEVTSMYGMFDGCYNLTSLDVSGFITAKVTNMRYMFNECELTTLDLSSFNTVQVANMEKMFRECSNLTTIYVGSGWTTTAVSSSSQMFLNCTKIKGGKGTTYDANHVDKAYAHIDGGTSNPGYLTAKGTTQPGDVSNDGEIDVNDVTRMISCILNDTPVDLATADMNGDNVVDVLDVTLLIAYILNN